MAAMRRALPLWLALFAAYSLTLGLDASPGVRLSAPEAHVLLTAESIVSDADLDLRDEYRTSAWQTWHPLDLTPTAAAREDGAVLEPHGIALPLVVAPAYALAGPTGAELLCAALMALAFCLAAALGRRLVPEPWPTISALVMGLSPPALGAATQIAPETVGAPLLAGAALLALRVREHPRLSATFWCAALAAAMPWLAVKLLAPAAVVALAMWRWLRRRQRGLAGFIALEVVLTSAVVYITVNDRVYGGLTPHAAAPPGGAGPTGATGVAEHLERWPRLVGLWLDREAGLLRWAPVLALAFVAVWLLWRSRRDRLAAVVDDQVDVEVTAAFLLLIAAPIVAVAVFLAPTDLGPAFPGQQLVVGLPVAAALAAWGLRHVHRLGAALSALTAVAAVWLLAGARVDDGAALQPPRGALPWGGAEDVLPRFGTGSGAETVLLAAAGAGLVALVAREWREVRRLQPR